MWKIFIRIYESEKHEIGSGTKLFITFLSLRFFDMRRERVNFFLCWLFHLNTTTCGPRRTLLVWPRQAPKINYLLLASNLNSNSPNQRAAPVAHKVVWSESRLFFFKSPKSLALPSMTSFTSSASFPIRGFYCDISDCHIHPAGAWTPALNVCT